MKKLKINFIKKSNTKFNSAPDQIPNQISADKVKNLIVELEVLQQEWKQIITELKVKRDEYQTLIEECKAVKAELLGTLRTFTH